MSQPNEAERLAEEIVGRVKAADHRPATGSDVNALSGMMEKLVREMKKDQELRKWAVAEAKGNVTEAEKIYGFVNAGSLKVIEKLNG